MISKKGGKKEGKGKKVTMHPIICRLKHAILYTKLIFLLGIGVVIWISGQEP